MFNGVSFHDVEIVNDKQCVVCSTFFTPRSGVHKFCSGKCKGKWKYITKFGCTDNQYSEINNNWHRYLLRLLYCDGRRRDGLTIEILEKILERQNYKCALSGVDLTCNLVRGTKFPTNVSVDRIIPGGPYTEDNIQLVCRALNSWRADLPLNEYIEWCRKVVEHQSKGKRGEDGRA